MIDADKFEILEDNTVKLFKKNEETNKYRTVGFVHSDRWDSISVVEYYDSDAQ